MDCQEILSDTMCQVALLQHFRRTGDEERAAGFRVERPGTRGITFSGQSAQYVAGVIRMAGLLGWKVEAIPEADESLATEGHFSRIQVIWRKMEA